MLVDRNVTSSVCAPLAAKRRRYMQETLTPLTSGSPANGAYAGDYAGSRWFLIDPLRAGTNGAHAEMQGVVIQQALAFGAGTPECWMRSTFCMLSIFVTIRVCRCVQCSCPASFGGHDVCSVN